MAAKKKAAPPARKSPASSRPKPAPTAAKTSARSTLSGPTNKGGAADISDAATAKIAGTEAVSASLPFNAAKPGEYRDPMNPPAGQTVEPPHPMVTGSTLTEFNASE